MAVAVDAVGFSSQGTTTQSWTHVVGASATDLIVWVAYTNPQATTYTATIDGVSITPVGHGSCSNGDTTIIAHLANPTPGSHTITVTPTPATNGTGVSLSFTGSNGIAGTHPSAAGNSATPTASFSGTTTGGMCAGAAQTQTTSFTGTSAGTEWKRINGGAEGQQIDVAVIPSTGSTASLGWSISTGQWATIGVELLPAAAGPVTVPNIVGDTQPTANTALTAVGLVGSYTTVSVGSPSQDGLVQSQTPTSGTSVSSGSTVTYTVGQYTAPTTTVPNIIGDTNSAATTALTGASLVGSSSNVAVGTMAQNGLVQSQSPASGSTVAQGSTVTYTIGVYVPPSATSVPILVRDIQSITPNVPHLPALAGYAPFDQVTVLTDATTTSGTTYTGYAPSGTATSVPYWTISAVNANGTHWTAKGQGTWDNRASETYL